MNQETSNPFAVAAQNQSALVQLAQSKEAQTIQAALVVAKKFPRDQHKCFQGIIEACKRRGLAEEAVYLYSRGGQTITGASIRLLEVISQQWGNFQSGIVELDNADGESRVQCFAWDLETNMFDSKTFTVKHERYSRAGGIEQLKESRDVYEHVANFAARRKRACMEAVIPRDIIDAAIEQCDVTVKSGHTEPIADRVRKIVSAFAEYGVTPEMIEKRLQHKLEAIIEQEIVLLRKIYTSLKDGMGKREDFFQFVDAPKPAKFEDPDEKAQAEAGLAPAQRTVSPPATPATPTPAPAAATTPAPSKRKKANWATTPAPAPVAQEPAPAQAPAPAPAPEPPAPQPAPAPIAPVTAPPPGGKTSLAEPVPPAKDKPADLFAPSPAPAPVAPAPAPQEQALTPEMKSAQLCATVYQGLKANGVTEAEVLNFMKSREICGKDIEQLVQVSDVTLEELIEQMPAVAAQCRIDRRAAARK